MSNPHRHLNLYNNARSSQEEEGKTKRKQCIDCGVKTHSRTRCGSCYTKSYREKSPNRAEEVEEMEEEVEEEMEEESEDDGNRDGRQCYDCGTRSTLKWYGKWFKCSKCYQRPYNKNKKKPTRQKRPNPSIKFEQQPSKKSPTGRIRRNANQDTAVNYQQQLVGLEVAKYYSTKYADEDDEDGESKALYLGSIEKTIPHYPKMIRVLFNDGSRDDVRVEDVPALAQLYQDYVAGRVDTKLVVAGKAAGVKEDRVDTKLVVTGKAAEVKEETSSTPRDTPEAAEMSQLVSHVAASLAREALSTSSPMSQDRATSRARQMLTGWSVESRVAKGRRRYTYHNGKGGKSISRKEVFRKLKAHLAADEDLNTASECILRMEGTNRTAEPTATEVAAGDGAPIKSTPVKTAPVDIDTPSADTPSVGTTSATATEVAAGDGAPIKSTPVKTAPVGTPVDTPHPVDVDTPIADTPPVGTPSADTPSVSVMKLQWEEHGKTNDSNVVPNEGRESVERCVVAGHAA